MTTFGILTAGGDCPGLNAVIRAVTTRAADHHGARVLGVRDGWKGLIENDVVELDRNAVRGILGKGGTMLGTSRMDPYVHGAGLASCMPTLDATGIDTLVVIGGDGSLRSALALSKEGLSVVGVPKTIDNDISGTDITFGHDTAVQVATNAIDRLTSTAEAHNRVMVVEVMGRTKGWIAVHAGIAGGADAILIPEVPYDLDEVAAVVLGRKERGRRYSLIVVAEGISSPAHETAPARLDAFGFERLGGVSYEVAHELEHRTGFETRVTVLGHTQRGGSPTAYDRILATRLGVAAADFATRGETEVMAALHGDRITAVPLEEACAEVRGVDIRRYEVAKTFFS